jgi:hypothetical protein
VGEGALPVEIANLEVRREADLLSRAASWQRSGGDALSRLAQVDLSRRGAAEALVRSQRHR